jgi:UDP-glucose 4-epimerase
VVSIFVDKLLNNEAPYIFGDGDQTRDFIYVKDIARANILALYKGDNELMNISTNKAITVNELFKMMKSISGSKSDVIHKEERKGDILHSYLDNRRAEEKLGWKVQFNLANGIRETVKYYRELTKAGTEVAALVEEN